jgi:hypothetical protein
MHDEMLHNDVPRDYEASENLMDQASKRQVSSIRPNFDLSESEVDLSKFFLAVLCCLWYYMPPNSFVMAVEFAVDGLVFWIVSSSSASYCLFEKR